QRRYRPLLQLRRRHLRQPRAHRPQHRAALGLRSAGQIAASKKLAKIAKGAKTAKSRERPSKHCITPEGSRKFLGLALYGEVARCSLDHTPRKYRIEATHSATPTLLLPWRSLLGGRRWRALRLAILAGFREPLKDALRLRHPRVRAPLSALRPVFARLKPRSPRRGRDGLGSSPR